MESQSVTHDLVNEYTQKKGHEGRKNRRQRMGNIEEQREVENNGQKEKGFDEQREVYRQRVGEAKNDMGWGEREVGF